MASSQLFCCLVVVVVGKLCPGGMLGGTDSQAALLPHKVLCGVLCVQGKALSYCEVQANLIDVAAACASNPNCKVRTGLGGGAEAMSKHTCASVAVPLCLPAARPPTLIFSLLGVSSLSLASAVRRSQPSAPMVASSRLPLDPPTTRRGQSHTSRHD